MTVEYPKVQLGHVLSPNQAYIERPEPRPYKKLSVRLYGRGVVLDAPADGSNLRMQRHQLARAGQVILSEIWGKKGAIGIVPPEGEGALCTSHFFLFDVDSSIVCSEYLDAVFRANYLQEQLGNEARGTTGYAAVRPKHLLSAFVPLPPLPEQRRLVARIEALAGKIEEMSRLRVLVVQQVDELVCALHLALADGRNVRLGDVLELHEERQAVMPGLQYPQVGVRSFGLGLFPKEAVDAGDTTYRNFNRLYSGAVVLSQVKGWEGAIGVCGDELAGRYASPEYRTFRCVPGQANPTYLSAVFSTPWYYSQLTSLTRGVGARRERIRPEFFLEMVMPMPHLQQQESALSTFGRIRQVRRVQTISGDAMKSLLPSILDKAFRGEL